MNKNSKPLQYKLLHQLTENNYSDASKTLECLLESKIRNRVKRKLQRVDEGLFDRLRAKASGTWSGVKAKAQNVGTRVSSAGKALSQVMNDEDGEGVQRGMETLRSAGKQIRSNDPLKVKKAKQADSLIAAFERDLSKLYPGLKAGKALTAIRQQINMTKVPEKLF